MPTFQLAGTVVPFGGATAISPVDLSFSIIVARPDFDENSHNGFSRAGVIRPDSSGAFSQAIVVSDGIAAQLAPRIIVLASVIAYAPASARQDVNLNLTFEGGANEIFTQIAANLGDLRVGLNLSQTTSQDVSVRPIGDVPALHNVNTLGVLALQTPNHPTPVGTAILRRSADGGSFVGQLICANADLDARQTWLVALASAVGPASTRAFDVPLQMGPILARSRATTGESDFNDASGNIGLVDAAAQIGLGDILAGLPAQTIEPLLLHPWQLFVRELGLTLANGMLNVSGRVGLGEFGFQFFGIGRFTASLSVTLISRDFQPFSAAELNSLVDLRVVQKQYDLFPDTDLDKFVGLIGALDQVIAQVIAPAVRDEIASQIAGKVRDQVNQKIASLTAALGADLAAQVRGSFFVRLSTLSVEANAIKVKGVGGVRHFIVALAGLSQTCPANAATTLHFNKRPMSTFRHYEKALSRPETKAWLVAFRRHAAELGRIVFADPALAAELIRVAGDLKPILDPELGAKFSRSALDQVALLATRVQPLVSQDLARTIDEVRAVLADGIDLDYVGLLRLAGDRQPTGQREASVD